MALAVCLLFDRRSERAIRALWDQLESLGVPSLRSHTHGRHVPHLSYAVLRSWDLASVTAALSGLDAGGPVDLSFDGIGLFRRGRSPGRRPAPGHAAGARRRRRHRHRGTTSCTSTTCPAPGCRTARSRRGTPGLPVLAAAVYDVLPLRAQLDRAALINSATGELWPLETLP